MKRKLLLDTDIGTDIDDALALPLLLSSPEVELLGITTVSDKTERRATYADVICRHMGRTVPIYAGASLPLAIPPVGNYVNAPHERMAGMYPYGPASGYGVAETIGFLRDTILANPGEVTLVCIGPLTNAALLFSLYPETVKALGSLCVMGGSYGENPRCDWDIRVEWNMKCDPYAAKIVMEADVKQLLAVGVEVTWDYQKPREAVYAMLSELPCMTPVAEGAVRNWQDKEIWFHDALLCATVLYPEQAELECGTITVDLEGHTVFTPGANGHCSLVRGWRGGDEAFYRLYRRNLILC